jgi:LPXTG-motif cell wall-anchored protein
LASAGLEGAATALDRIDIERATSAVADLPLGEVYSTAAAASDMVIDQASSVVAYGRRLDTRTRAFLLAGAAVVLVVGVLAVRRRKRNDEDAAVAATLAAA